MFFTGDKTFVGFGVAHDDRRRDRRARLAHGAAGAARRARRPRREGCACRSCTGCAAPTARAAFWSAILDRVLRRPLVSVVARRRAPGRARRPGAAACTSPSPASRRFPQNLSALADLRQAPEARSPARRLRAGRRQGRRRDARRSRPRSPTCSAQALATGQFSAPIDVDVTGTARSRSSRSRSPGNGTTPSRARARTTLRDDVIPATVGSSPAPTSASPARPPAQNDFNEQMKQPRRSCSRSCSRSRSCCCWSRSGRS